jgi:prostatic aicd phosphatase
VGATLSTLTNGSTEYNPLNGYQYVLTNGISANAPDTIWVKGDQFCPAMTNASIVYFLSPEFLSRQTELQPFYDKFTPLLTGIFLQSQIGFQSAYGIFDYLNVGYIHNETIYSNITSNDLLQLRTLADSTELAQVYNTSSGNASIGGKTLSGAILTALNSTASGTNKNLKVTYYATSYSIFQAFWGISGLLKASPNFYGLPDYASTMAIELRQPVNSTGLNDLVVRFGFRNGSLPTTELITYPMFGRSQSEGDMPWSSFEATMAAQSITTQRDWCNTCVSNLTFCAAYSTNLGLEATGTNINGESFPSVSPVAAGFIGAGVTIAIVASVEALGALVWYRRRRSALGEKFTGSEISSDRRVIA